MKTLNNLKVIVGLGKTGFSCVEFLLKKGANVAVTDSRAEPPFLDELKKQFPQVITSMGGFDETLIMSADELIVSPGVALREPMIANAIAKGIPAIGDIELFARDVKAPVIGITGTNGKSTVTALVGEMAKQAGLNVGVGGNLGTPVLEMLANNFELYVLELSSFQLETTYTLKLAAATVLNISPDHMDRYSNLEEYIAAKQRIFQHCKIAVINRQDPVSYSGLEHFQRLRGPAAAAPRRAAHDRGPRFRVTPSAVENLSLNNKMCLPISFGLDEPKVGEFGIRKINNIFYLTYGEQNLLPVNQLQIKGKHQWANALAALALGHAYGLPMQAMLTTLQTFPGLPHRCQWVRNLHGVDWYNDSKGTNVNSTLAAIEGLGATITGQLILLAGGLGKQQDFSPLREPAHAHVRTVILFGEDAKLIAAALSEACSIIFVSDFIEAIKLAKQNAQAGDAVLLSPACASFDMFKNFEHRGEVFIEAVKKLN